jgi:poly(hydroxyalkanoate) granule-associated protein
MRDVNSQTSGNTKKGAATMFEMLDRIMLAGLGALSMTKEKAEKLFDEYVEQGRRANEERSGFVKDVMDSADKTRKELERIVSEQVQQAVAKIEVATKADIARLEQKLDACCRQQ